MQRITWGAALLEAGLQMGIDLVVDFAAKAIISTGLGAPVGVLVYLGKGWISNMIQDGGRGVIRNVSRITY